MGLFKIACFFFQLLSLFFQRVVPVPDQIFNVEFMSTVAALSCGKTLFVAEIAAKSEVKAVVGAKWAMKSVPKLPGCS